MRKEFLFYSDKIVKTSKLFSHKQMKYIDSELGITMIRSNPIFNALSAYSFYRKVIYFNMHIYNKHISIDRSMISKDSENKIIDYLSKLLNQDVREKNKQNNRLHFDLK